MESHQYQIIIILITQCSEQPSRIEDLEHERVRNNNILQSEFYNLGYIKLRFPGIFHSNQSPRREEKIEGPLWGIDLWRGAEPLDVKFHQAPWGLAGCVW
ncbi:Hypothetical_protein [Hexamita inflata]|uniref:Hypothetical_protein n=1 Tax=Hexamita inflata TaxID=28002 RepID=A0AA86NMI9_9EUKA|nr:Hypothetical protein HINF_LOCUS9802 [Hexamita inflata]